MNGKVKQPTSVNTRWFAEHLAANHLSMRQLAKLLKLDPSAVSLMLRGKRKMTPTEANSIARILSLPVTEVLRKAGVQISEDTRTLPLRWRIDAEGRLTEIKKKPLRNVHVPPDVPLSGFAVQVTVPEKEYDGWILYCTPAGPGADVFIGRMVMASADEKTVVGFLHRGYEPGTFNVRSTFGDRQHENLTIKNLSLVNWIQPV